MFHQGSSVSQNSEKSVENRRTKETLFPKIQLFQKCEISVKWTGTWTVLQLKEREPSTDFQQIPLIPDNYRVLGRVVHMNYVKEQLETERHSLTFAVTQEEVNKFNLDVFADVVYVEVRF